MQKGLQFFPDKEMLFSTGSLQSEWHEKAFGITREKFGADTFIRGVVEVSNYCRENCCYCGMRRDNRALDRHRATVDELAEVIMHGRPKSITDINIQTGEDPVAVRQIVIPLIRLIKAQTSLGVSVCLGTLDPLLYEELKSAGASMYIMKFESGSLDQYARHASPGTLVERKRHIRLLAKQGWFVSSGFIAGLPEESIDDLLANFCLADDLPLDGCSVSPFVPGEATPLADCPAASLDVTLNCMASLRLMKPSWVIPAVSALNLQTSEGGYLRGLQAGANLCTINLTPKTLRKDYLLYKRDRFIMTEERILNAIGAAGLRPSDKGLMSLQESFNSTCIPGT